MYLTYEEYSDMGGTLDEAAFTDLEFEARAYIDWVTFNRLHKQLNNIPESVKECMYHIIRIVQNKLEAMNVGIGAAAAESSKYGAGIASQSNDGVSISYNTLSARDVIETSEAQINQAIRRYLSGVKDTLGHQLLYRGLYADE